MKRVFVVIALVAGFALWVWKTREVSVTAQYQGSFDVPPPAVPKLAVGANVFARGPRAVSFLLEAGGRKVMVSALHVFADSMSISLEASANELLPHQLKQGERLLARSGKARVPSGAEWGSATDCSGDFIELSAEPEADAEFLTLSRDPLELGAPVWVYTLEGGTTPQLFKAKLGLASNRVLRLEESSAPNGLISGSPVVNAKGEVIGVISQVGSGPNGTSAQWAVPLAALRKHFKQ
ncbi:MAG: hypothetical protein U0228_14090 [Myxococcaceae bacterium]